MIKTALANLFGRTVLISSHDPRTLELLNLVFGSFRCNVIRAACLENFLSAIEDNHLIDIVIYEVPASIDEGVEILKKVATSDLERVAMYFVTSDPAESLDEAYFHGTDGIFRKPLHFDELTKGIAYTFAQMIDSTQRQHRRLRIRCARASVSLADISLSGFVTNISSGGMFVTSKEALPAANQVVNFKVEYESKKSGAGLVEVSGRGVVRWLRPYREYGQPPGFGLEFTDLDEGTSETLRAIHEKQI